MKWVYVLLALLYTAFPYDLLPDFLTGIGWVDDLVVLGFLLRFLYLQFGRTRRGGQDGGAGRHTGKSEASVEGEGEGGEADGRFDSPDPYVVIGVAPSASEDHIKKAYRELVSRYHPDKVTHLGDEFKTLAEKRLKQINQAYQKIKQVNR